MIHYTTLYACNQFTTSDQNDKNFNESTSFIEYFMFNWFQSSDTVYESILEWLANPYNDMDPHKEPYLVYTVMILQKNDNSIIFFYEDDWALFKNNPNTQLTTRFSMSEKNFKSIIEDIADIYYAPKPLRAYIIDKEGWIYIDTKLPDEVGVEITKVQKE